MGPASGPESGSALQSRRSRSQLQLQSLIQSLRSLRGLGGIKPRWDLGPPPRYLRDDLGGTDPPRGPEHQVQGSLHHLGLNRHLHRQQRRAHRPIYGLLRGSDGPFLLGPRYRGMSICARDFHGESYYDVSALTVDLRFRDSMRLIAHYSLLPFMTPR